ncbi:MAG: GH3 auxin-responsive promoter family protein [Candidatus Azobacteroides sp.]|nr:GH3 auxin-responsive promoter family protein [Candidatus Azobacteroides sp.]
MSITRLISYVFKPRQKQIENFNRNGIDIQYNQLHYLLKKGRHTAFGKKYGFNKITDYRSFSRFVPLYTYESLYPYIERMLKGEKNILWPSDIKWFAKSSGTTNDKSKYIPVSKEGLRNCHYAGGRDSLALYLKNNPESRIFNGKALILGGSLDKSNLSNQIQLGDLSAVMIKNIPSIANLIRVPDKNIALMDEWIAKLEAITEKVIYENVTNLSGVPSWFLVLIKSILQKTGKTSLTEVWPNLEVFFHGGISFDPYVEQYKALIPSSTMHYQETYNASEGFFGIQNNPQDKSMLLMLDYGVFYEFIPLEQLEKENPSLVPLEGIEAGKHYAMVITTNSGLWRYMIGDTIQFTSKDPYKFLITGRTKQFMNAFGEELMVHNADAAFKNACRKTHAIIKDYTAAPVYMSSKATGHHQWLVEFERFPDSIELFTSVFDETLKTVNSDYEAKRYNNMILSLPEIIIARENLFYDWLEHKNKLGGQHKVPRLSNDRKYMDELLLMNIR